MSDDKLVQKLKRLSTKQSRPKVTSTASYPQRYRRLADATSGRVVTRDNGAFCQIITHYEFEQSHGQKNLPHHPLSTQLALSSFSLAERSEQVRLGDLLFFDLETTGLGGTGAVAFLIGVGRVTRTGFEIRQYLLPDYSDEAAQLDHFLADFKEGTSLVSYNGASFDENIMRDRMIINRVARALPYEHHIDLLHPARRLFRRRLSSCTLKNIEEQLFGFYRTDDIPGHLIPSVYFDWLASEEIGYLPQVLEHNRWDILSMYFLLFEIAEIFATEGAGLDHADDLYSLAKVLGKRRHHERAVRIYEQLPQSSGRVAADMQLHRAMLLKRTGDLGGAVELWRRIARSSSREGFLANLELAKFFEHRERNLAKAIDHASRALTNCPPSKTQRKQLDRRLARLKRKRND